MRRVCIDMVDRLPELAHIDLSTVAICFVQARSPSLYGVQATLTPMRFDAGSRTVRRRGATFRVQTVVDRRGVEMLYLLSFYLPRFLNQPFLEKLITILHELWHISPRCNGDLRRHPGRCYIHGTSHDAYDALARRLACQWMARQPSPALYAFLHLDFRQLMRLHGPIVGQRVATPKLVPDASGVR